MRILVFRGDGQVGDWVHQLSVALPHAEVVGWRPAAPELARSVAPAHPRRPRRTHAEPPATRPCDYAVIWQPTVELLEQLTHVKAIFLMGAGVDAILKFGDALPPVPVIRLGDAGMAAQMAEYVSYAVLRYFRQFPQYEELARERTWSPLEQFDRNDFPVGVLGMGKLGMRVIEAMQHFGFPVRGWSRTAREVEGVDCFSGMDELKPFLRGTRALACLLPLTSETAGLLNRERLGQLPAGAFLINVSRGAIVAEEDLLALVRSSHIRGATLDVFAEEPLRAEHPFWAEPRITITPHISARTLLKESVRQIAAKIEALEQGQPVDDVVDRNRGY